MNFYILRKIMPATLGLFLIVVSSANAAGIDVLVLYSNGIRTVSQGRDPAATAAAFIAYANQTYRRSRVNMQLRAVGVRQISISGGSKVSSAALNNLARDQRVARLRSQYGADLVAYLTLRQESGRGFLCGIGYVPGGTNGRFYRGAKGGGFSVSAVNCGSVTPVHEWGHNMGLGHSYAQRSRGGIYPWARGHGEFNNFATVMAYPQAYGRARRVQQFSSPNQFKCNRLRCGISSNRFNGADAVRNLNTVANQVAAFMPPLKKR